MPKKQHRAFSFAQNQRRMLKNTSSITLKQQERNLEKTLPQTYCFCMLFWIHLNCYKLVRSIFKALADVFCEADVFNKPNNNGETIIESGERTTFKMYGAYQEEILN